MEDECKKDGVGLEDVVRLLNKTVGINRLPLGWVESGHPGWLGLLLDLCIGLSLFFNA